MKPCTKCGLSDRRKNGRCKPCAIAATAAWKSVNREHIKEYDAAYRAANPEKVTEMYRAYEAKRPIASVERKRVATADWCKANIERSRAIKHKWAKANPEKSKASASKWEKANPEKKRALTAKRRATKLNATPKWANKLFIEEAYDLAVRRAKATGIAWHVDHIVPLRSKVVCGLHVEFNLRVIPAIENLRKGNRFE